MPVHDRTRVKAGIFHDFHLSWIDELKAMLNDRVLPHEYYALAEQIASDTIPAGSLRERAAGRNLSGRLETSAPALAAQG